MMIARRSQYQKAIDKAQQLGSARLVRQPQPGLYTVPASQGGHYTVRFLDSELVCSCPAGQKALPCYHSAAVWQVRTFPGCYQQAQVPASPARQTADYHPLPADTGERSYAALLNQRPRQAAA